MLFKALLVRAHRELLEGINEGVVRKLIVAKVIDVYADADWAGCWNTRKSTSGGAAVINGACTLHYTSLQKLISLSSAESELYALVQSAARGLGMQKIAEDFGLKLSLRVHADASAAIGAANRIGAGRMRHVAVRQLWIQEALRRNRFELLKIDGGSNPADCLTKPKNNSLETLGWIGFLRGMT